MNRSRSLLALALALVAFAALAAGGCSRNEPGTLLAPTGYRPAPAQWSGRLVGKLFYDPINTPDLATAPYPPTRVELWRFQPDTLMVAVDSLTNTTTWFDFEHLSPSVDYRVKVFSAMFYEADVNGIKVNENRVDAGNLTLRVNPNATAAGMEIIGTMPGFRLADLDYGMWFPLDSTRAGAPALGVWEFPYPNPLPANPNEEDLAYWGFAQRHKITAGTYHFKFVTDFPDDPNNLGGWGNPLGGTLTAPVTNHPAVRATGPATDIVMTFPTTGVYRFTLDERRQTFSVSFDHAVPALAARAVRR